MIGNRIKHFYANENGFSKDVNEVPSELVDTIICGDSLNEIKNLPDSCIDLILTSPPYNFGMDYDNTEDAFDWDKYFSDLFSVFDECIRVLKYGGRFIINIQPCFSDYVPTHHFISYYMMQKMMIWKGEVIWDKQNYNCKYTAWGSWKSPSNPYLKYTWEFIEIYSKGDIKMFGDKESVDIDAESFKKWVVAKWDIAPEHTMSRYGHPAMFPEEIAYRCLKLFSYKNSIVLDPFAGAGTTCVVAKKTQRHYIGIDISKEYCDTAEERIHSILI